MLPLIRKLLSSQQTATGLLKYNFIASPIMHAARLAEWQAIQVSTCILWF